LNFDNRERAGKENIRRNRLMNNLIIKKSRMSINKRKDDVYVAISILRVGNSMVEELLIIMPGINVGNILVQRDETTKEKKARFYFEKLPAI